MNPVHFAYWPLPCTTNGVSAFFKPFINSASVFSAGRRLFVISLLISLPFSAAESLEPNITPSEQKLMSWLAVHETEMINLPERLININSGNSNKAGMA